MIVHELGAVRRRRLSTVRELGGDHLSGAPPADLHRFGALAERSVLHLGDFTRDTDEYRDRETIHTTGIRRNREA
jgi:hypothetical protein